MALNAFQKSVSGIYICGTLRQNRGDPKELKIEKNNLDVNQVKIYQKVILTSFYGKKKKPKILCVLYHHFITLIRIKLQS